MGLLGRTGPPLDVARHVHATGHEQRQDSEGDPVLGGLGRYLRERRLRRLHVREPHALVPDLAGDLGGEALERRAPARVRGSVREQDEPLHPLIVGAYNRRVSFTLTSPAFADGEPIPKRHTGEGKDTSPPLAWSGAPAETRSLALIVDDPDAPRGLFTHWLAWNLEPDAGGLREGERPRNEGLNDFPKVGYGGPMPPRGHGRHRYVFRLHALDARLELPRGATRLELERALAGHVLATCELVRTYERP